MGNKVYCVVMRGGTSKCIFFREADVPADIEERTRFLCRVMGSPDRRQIDGLGGADLLTSKVAMVGPSLHPNADVNYTFGQVSIDKAKIDYSLICGNISAAVGPFAIEEGMVKPEEPITTIRVFSPAYEKILNCEVPVKEGKPLYEGDYAIDGVPGTGAKITLDYAETEGAKTGRLLPSGKSVDVIAVEGLGEIEVTLVDCANPGCFVKAESLGLRGNETPEEIDNNPDVVDTIRRVREAASPLLGIGPDFVFPGLFIVSRPMPWIEYSTGKTLEADRCDILCKSWGFGMVHKAFSGTCTIMTGAAAKIRGTVVNQLLSSRGHAQDEVIIGHPSGTIPISVRASESNGVFTIEKASISRTARRIMDGYVYV